jgi:hypothetical protein
VVLDQTRVDPGHHQLPKNGIQDGDRYQRQSYCPKNSRHYEHLALFDRDIRPLVPRHAINPAWK